MIARESSRDTSTKLLYCTEAIVALMMQARLMSTAPPFPQDVITTVVIDEVHNRSAHSDCVLALTLAHPVGQARTKERMFLHGILDTKGVSRIGYVTACMDLPCEWAQFLYVCAERGLEDGAIILIATW